ncbi:MAG: tagaturonate epimerase family protein [Candidatus Sumerlaeia bacterium]
MKPLARFSMGFGDRFAHEAAAQLRAMQMALEQGVEIIPVWNKSNREHTLIGSKPADVRRAAEAAVAEVGWRLPWHCDADHIGLANVDIFMEACDFFTLDVADFIGGPIPGDAIARFADRHPELIGEIEIEGIADSFRIDRARLETIARKYLPGVLEASRIYGHIAQCKGAGNFITEVSMDETDYPQTPDELLVILAGLADANVAAETIAPKFTGRFNKGVDYVGDVAQFAREFDQDICVIHHAIKAYGLPATLKLSVHSGSDKFSLYGPMREALDRRGAGVHLKTAGTNWLEELIGLAECGGAAAQIVKDIYATALERKDEMCKPYLTVVDIDPAGLPSAREVAGWSGERLAAALRHEQACPEFNINLRQLLHVAFKLAAEMGPRYIDAIEANAEVCGRNVTNNIFDRHVRPLFLPVGAAALSK